MLWLVIITAVFLFFWVRILLKASKLPPGPLPFPLLGNVIQFGYDLYLEGGTIPVMQKWAKKYGPVFTFWMGPLATVNICDWQIAHDSMVKKGQVFADRGGPYLLQLMRNGLGIIFCNGEFWREQRRFALHSLRNFGLGKNVMEERIMMEVNHRWGRIGKLEKFRELHLKIEEANWKLEIDPQDFIEITVGNIINRILTGERFTEAGEKTFFELKGKVDHMADLLSPLDLMLDKWHFEIPYFKNRVKKFLKPQEELVAFIDEQIQRRKTDIAEELHELKDEPDDFVDCFLAEMKKHEGDENTSFTHESLLMTMIDLWIAGQETSSTTLLWALAYLTLHPEVLMKVEAELDVHTQRSRPLEMADRQHTPYFNAIITETLRVASLAPLSLWRKASEDVRVGGYLIPKGTDTVAHTSLITLDDKYFKDPYTFDPDRYIRDPSLDQYSVSFGVGKRSCLGESLAKAELYLILGNLLIQFGLRASESLPPQMKARDETAPVRRPQPFKIIMLQKKLLCSNKCI